MFTLLPIKYTHIDLYGFMVLCCKDIRVVLLYVYLFLFDNVCSYCPEDIGKLPEGERCVELVLLCLVTM